MYRQRRDGGPTDVFRKARYADFRKSRSASAELRTILYAESSGAHNTCKEMSLVRANAVGHGDFARDEPQVRGTTAVGVRYLRWNGGKAAESVGGVICRGAADVLLTCRLLLSRREPK